MRRLGLRWMTGLAWTIIAACGSPAATPTRPPAELPVEEIEGPVAPPKPEIAANPHDLRAAGDYYYRAHELGQARWFYRACSKIAEGQLQAACQWGRGATYVVEGRQQADEEQRRYGLRSRPLIRCTQGSYEFEYGLRALREAYRTHATARRALVLAALYEELGSECPPKDCPPLPFDWHRRDGEHEVLGSGLEGSSRERVFACFRNPSEYSSETWSYWRGSCTAQDDPTAPQIKTTVRLHFEDDIVVRVTHERTVHTQDCGLRTTYDANR
jgi:hypothetical protein